MKKKKGVVKRLVGSLCIAFGLRGRGYERGERGKKWDQGLTSKRNGCLFLNVFPILFGDFILLFLGSEYREGLPFFEKVGCVQC